MEKRGYLDVSEFFFFTKVIMIEQKNLNLEKKRSCLRFQILKARVGKGCFGSSLYIFSIGNCMTSLVLTIMAGRGERGGALSKIILSTIISYVSVPFFQLSLRVLAQHLSKCPGHLDTKCPLGNLCGPSVSNSSIQSIVIIIILQNRHKIMVLLPRTHYC